MSHRTWLLVRYFCIIPQAILFPEFPEGCVVKSSGLSWIITVVPMISLTVKRSVKNIKKAYP